MYSLRRTLAVRFSLTILLTLLFLGLWAFVGARWTVNRELDRGLASALELEIAVLAAGGTVVPLRQVPAEPDSFIALVNRFVAVRDDRGAVLAANTEAAGTLPLDDVAFAAARGGGRGWVTQEWGERPVRSVYGPVPGGALPPAAVVQVAASLDLVEGSNRIVFLVMLGAVAVATAATAVGAGWLATQAVLPVAEITDQARALDPARGPVRITAHADVEEFQALVGVLNEVLERLRGSIEGQRRIIADVGHELRTPLAAMHGTLEVTLRSPRRPEHYQEVLGSCREEVEHLTAISESLILLARLEADELRPALAPTDLVALAEQAVGQLGSRAGDRTVEVSKPSSGEAHAEADGRMIGLVVEHLLSNAVQHTPPGTQIVLSVSSDGGWVTLAVDDSGPGIPEPDLPMLFERFYRADASRTRTAGAGLGLTISAAIVAAHGGTIGATRSRLGGLSVRISWPIVPR